MEVSAVGSGARIAIDESSAAPVIRRDDGDGSLLEAAILMEAVEW